MLRTKRAEFTGRRAMAWLQAQRWNVSNVTDEQTVRVSYDRISTRDFVVGRVWHTPMTLHIVPPSWSGHLSLVLLALSGQQTVEIDGGSHTLESPEVLVNVENVPFDLHSQEVSAHAFFWVPRRRVAPWANGMMRVQPFRAGPGFHETTVSAAMSALNVDFAPHSPAQATWAIGMEQLVLALVQETLKTTVLANWSPVALEARRLARSRAVDPDFNVAKLADALEITPTHLHRVMQPTGVTAGELIREQRLHLATELLTGQTRTREDLERVAALTGFPSARALRTALSRQEERES